MCGCVGNGSPGTYITLISAKCNLACAFLSLSQRCSMLFRADFSVASASLLAVSRLLKDLHPVANSPLGAELKESHVANSPLGAELKESHVANSPLGAELKEPHVDEGRAKARYNC